MSGRQFNIPLVIIAVILGVTTYKDFDFDTFSFKRTWLDLVFILAFIVTLVLLFKKKAKQ